MAVEPKSNLSCNQGKTTELEQRPHNPKKRCKLDIRKYFFSEREGYTEVESSVSSGRSSDAKWFQKGTE